MEGRRGGRNEEGPVTTDPDVVATDFAQKAKILKLLATEVYPQVPIISRSRNCCIG